MSPGLSFDVISRPRHLLVLGALVACLIPRPLSAEEISIPPIGQAATYSCRGDYGGEYRYTVESVENDVVHYRLKAQKHARKLTMPIWMLGTSLYMKDEGDGYGNGRMTDGLEHFAGLRSLAVGTEFTGEVKEVASGQGVNIWNYIIKVSDKRMVHDRVLGDVEIYVINERRTAGSRWSERESLLSPAHAELVSSTYRDSSGNKRECHIVVLHRPQ
jgi:hypothetical protein